MTVRCIRAFAFTYIACAILAGVIGCSTARMVYNHSNSIPVIEIEEVQDEG
jgi:hypothetical protein